MSRNIQLLKQVRNVASNLNKASENPEHKVLLSIADMFLNELMLQDDDVFYLDFLARGKALLAEGTSVAAKVGHSVRHSTTALAPRDDLNPDMRIEAINAEIELLNDNLLAVVKVLDENRSSEEKGFLVRLTEWESSLYARRLEQVTSSAKTEDKSITSITLQAYLADKFPEWKGLKVTKFVTLEGGISKKTILFETEDELNGHQAMVLRAEQAVNMLFFEGSDVTQEFYIIALMHQLGMPVPKALWLEQDASLLGVRFLATTKSEGKNFAGSLGSKEPPPPETLDSILSVFYQMHDLKFDPADPLLQKSHLNEWMPYKTLRDVARYNAAVYVPRMIQRAGIKQTPQLLRALRWLEHNAPDSDEPPVLVHVDYAFNNILLDNNRVSAVLDWETSRLGDPADDIIWTQHNLGVYTMPEFLKVYEQASGRHVSEYRIAYARVQKCVLNMIAGLTALKAIDEDDHSPLHMGVMAFKYMPLFGADVGQLIAAAEKIRG